MRFVREGASSALSSVLSLANLAFLAVDALSSAVSTRASGAIKVQRQPDHVTAAAVDEFRNVVSGIVTGAADGSERYAVG
ncbi:hypothetical protein [Microvirga pakistanensis]|uniref:hypothetical protein n=1 Tax=Microvirga pakistanensis TaxID=1682650 RepID=UPI00106CBE16|nr:hypothetical protein [Microvirga pakistanensis]